MSVRAPGDETGDATGGGKLSKVVATAPWVVVMLGTALLVVLLVIAVLSFRGPELPAAAPPGPPAGLAIPAVTDAPASAESSSRPSRPSSAPPSPSASSAQPARTASSAAPPQASPSPTQTASAQPLLATDAGDVTASYRVWSRRQDSFRAVLVVGNETDQASDWRVELRFTGDVTGVRASSGRGVSVTVKGSGWYLLSGTRPLEAGAKQYVQLRFSRTGGDERPALCTVNGADCVIH